MSSIQGRSNSSMLTSMSSSGKNIGAHNVPTEEKTRFVEYINFLLKDDEQLSKELQLTPVNSADDSIYTAVGNGVLLAKFINALFPGQIDLRKLKIQKQMSTFNQAENQNIVLKAARDLGIPAVNIGAEDLVNGLDHQHLVMALIWQTIRTFLEKQMSRVAEAPSLSASYKGKSTSELLIKWVNELATRTGCTHQIRNLQLDITDSEAYLYVLASLNVIPSAKEELEKLPRGDALKRAQRVVEIARGAQLSHFLAPEDIVNGNTRLNFAFVANLFLHAHKDLLPPITAAPHTSSPPEARSSAASRSRIARPQSSYAPSVSFATSPRANNASSSTSASSVISPRSGLSNSNRRTSFIASPSSARGVAGDTSNAAADAVHSPKEKQKEKEAAKPKEKELEKPKDSVPAAVVSARAAATNIEAASAPPPQSHNNKELELRNEKAKLEEHVRDLESQARELGEKLAAKDAEINSKAAQNLQQKLDYESRIAELTNIKKEHESAWQAQAKQIEELRNELAETQRKAYDKVKQLEREKTELENQIDRSNDYVQQQALKAKQSKNAMALPLKETQEDATKTGWLHKGGNNNKKSFKKRFCVLRDNYLFYYESDSLAKAKHAKWVRLNGARVELIGDRISDKRKNLIQITPHEVGGGASAEKNKDGSIIAYEFSAATPELMNEWYLAIKMTIDEYPMEKLAHHQLSSRMSMIIHKNKSPALASHSENGNLAAPTSPAPASSGAVSASSTPQKEKQPATTTESPSTTTSPPKPKKSASSSFFAGILKRKDGDKKEPQKQKGSVIIMAEQKPTAAEEKKIAEPPKPVETTKVEEKKIEEKKEEPKRVVVEQKQPEVEKKPDEPKPAVQQSNNETPQLKRNDSSYSSSSPGSSSLSTD